MLPPSMPDIGVDAVELVDDGAALVDLSLRGMRVRR
jgi:hypothetical protein